MRVHESWGTSLLKVELAFVNRPGFAGDPNS